MQVFVGKLDEHAVNGTPSYMVAIKTAKGDAGVDDLLKEAMVMAMIPHHNNLVSLIGVVTSGDPKLLLCAYCDHGSLLSYLEKLGSKTNVACKLNFALDVATGMEHLTSHQVGVHTHALMNGG